MLDYETFLLGPFLLLVNHFDAKNKWKCSSKTTLDWTKIGKVGQEPCSRGYRRRHVSKICEFKSQHWQRACLHCTERNIFWNGPSRRLFLFIFVFSTINSKYVHYKNLPMIGFELRTYGPTYPPTYLPTYLPKYLPTYIPTYLLIYLPTYLPKYLPTYLPICILSYLLIYLCTYMHTYLPTYIPTYMPTFLPIYLLSYLYTYLPTNIPTYLYTYPPTYLYTYLPIYLPTYIPIYLPTYLPNYILTYQYTYLGMGLSTLTEEFESVT